MRVIRAKSGKPKAESGPELLAFRFSLSAFRSPVHRGLQAGALLLAVLLALVARPVVAGEDGDAWRSGHPDADIMDPDEIPFPDAKPNSPDQIPFPDAQPRAHDETPDPDAKPRAHDEIDFPDAEPRDPDEVDAPDAKPRAHDVIPFPDAKPRDPDEIDPDDE